MSNEISFDNPIVNEAERALVANALLDAKCYTEAGLDAALFFSPTYREIWRAIGKLVEANAEVSVFTVADKLGNSLEGCGGISGLAGMLAQYADYSPTSHNVEIVREDWLKREAVLLTSKIQRLHQNGGSGQEMLNRLQSELDRLEAAQSRKLPTLREVHDRETSALLADMAAIDRGEQLYFGLPTGLGIERIVPGGLPIGKVVALYGESGNFKTTTKNNLVWGVARSSDSRVIDFSFEDDDELTTQRFLAYNSEVSYGKIATRSLSKEQLQTVTNLTTEQLSYAGQVYLGGEVAPDINEIIRISRSYSRTRGVRCVVLDYIQLVSSDREHLDRAMRLLQLSAKRDSLCYVVVSQVKQDVDFRASKGENARPRITDMLGTSAFRTAPKLAIGVYRPAKYHPDPEPPKNPNYPDYTRLLSSHPQGTAIYKNIVELWITKNVLGEPGVFIPLSVDVTTGKMQELDSATRALIVKEE